ncbi:MAG TPA: class I tRNA ligase family protein, partial [Gammaproteobacteria bacterium]|nr:class I tRNA ligase family protein [Gammaproteobacteria bacterium]
GGMGTMSKSKLNGVDPQSLVETYGADTVRLFMMFAAPPEHTLEWSDNGLEGAARFLKRLWKAVFDHVNSGSASELDKKALNKEQRELRRQVHEAIQKASRDIGQRRVFNTAIAAVMELLNAVSRFKVKTSQDRAVIQEALEAMVCLLAPIVPHICETLWQALGNEGLVMTQTWPAVDESALVRDSVTVVVQVNGKLRGKIEVAADADRATVEAEALANEKVKRFLDDTPVRKVIVVPGKLVNVVV